MLSIHENLNELAAAALASNTENSLYALESQRRLRYYINVSASSKLACFALLVGHDSQNENACASMVQLPQAYALQVNLQHQRTQVKHAAKTSIKCHRTRIRLYRNAGLDSV